MLKLLEACHRRLHTDSQAKQLHHKIIQLFQLCVVNCLYKFRLNETLNFQLSFTEVMAVYQPEID